MGQSKVDRGQAPPITAPSHVPINTQLEPLP
jgi:hypothetical protein